MNKLYTKDYIEYLLDTELFDFIEDGEVVDYDADLDSAHLVRGIETSSGEEDDVAVENDQSSIIENIFEKSTDSIEQSVNSNGTEVIGRSYFQFAQSHFNISDISTDTGRSSLSFNFLHDSNDLFSDRTEISYQQSAHHSAEPVYKVLLTQNFIVDELLNLSPEAAYDFFTTLVDASVSGNLLVNNGFGADFDADGGLLSVVSGTFTTNSGGSLTISSDGGFVYTPLNGYTGADSFSYDLIDSDGATDTSQAGIHVSVGELVTHIDFSNAVFSDYGVEHNFSDVYSVADDGRTLHMADNTWKDIALDYTVTDNTVIEFDYFSTKEGQIQGLGFDRDDSISEPYTFKVFGTQDWGNSSYETYDGNEGNWFHYTIEVGSFYTGNFNRLFFVNDDDEYVGSNGSFRDVRIYEEASDADDTYTGSGDSETIMGLGGDDLIYGMGGDDVLYGGSGIDFLFGGGGADTFVFDDINDIDHVQDFDVNEGDILDISNLLTGYDPVTDAIADFVTVTSDGSQTAVYVDGDGGADSFVQVAVLHGVADLGSVESLEDTGALITV